MWIFVCGKHRALLTKSQLLPICLNTHSKILLIKLTFIASSYWRKKVYGNCVLFFFSFDLNKRTRSTFLKMFAMFNKLQQNKYYYFLCGLIEKKFYLAKWSYYSLKKRDTTNRTNVRSVWTTRQNQLNQIQIFKSRHHTVPRVSVPFEICAESTLAAFVIHSLNRVLSSFSLSSHLLSSTMCV